MKMADDKFTASGSAAPTDMGGVGFLELLLTDIHRDVEQAPLDRGGGVDGAEVSHA